MHTPAFVARWQERLVDGLYEEVRADAGRPRLSIALVAAYAVAGLVHVFTLALIVCGVLLILTFSLFPMVFGAILLGFAWLLFPRPDKLPEDLETLDRARAPRLFDLLDEVADRASSPRVHMVMISGRVNASVRTYGWRRRRYLEIGYPLWQVLTPQERVALLGHEFGHFSNGDTRRSLVVGTALDALTSLHRTASPAQSRAFDGIAFLAVIVVNTFWWVIRRLVEALTFLLGLATYRASQRAEYYADVTAARVAGTSAASGLLDALVTRGSITESYVYLRALHSGDDFWERLEQRIAEAPEEELERLRAEDRAGGKRIDQSHPPTHLRHSHVAALPYEEGVVSASGMDAVDAELAPSGARMILWLREWGKSALRH
ncbi:M48 family metallopeptidase [Nonomuraea sp. NPDC050556]|uniref:M48 family metallopeptidase n=1 Tax=Nonomuraea sp. NPDC050556 TaxID=3364369 RepID=UPI0037B6D3BE